MGRDPQERRRKNKNERNLGGLFFLNSFSDEIESRNPIKESRDLFKVVLS